MNVNIDYKDSLQAIDQAIASLPKELEVQEKEVLKRIGDIIKRWVIHFLSESDIEERAVRKKPENYDNSSPYVHAKQEVVSSVRKNKKGDRYVSVRGGKKTGFKWHMINDGHMARDGRSWVPGNPFIDQALAKAQEEINQAVDEMLRKVTG